MEKYSEWMDKGTGIKPFIPVAATNRSTVALGIWAIKAVLLLPLVLLWAALHTAGLGGRLGNWLLQLLMGFGYQVSVDGVKKRELRARHLPQRNRVYVTNFASPLDGLAAAVVSAAPVMLLVPRGDKLYQFSPWQLGWFALRGALDVPSGQPTVDPASAANSGCALFVFAEGTTSAGRGILPFQLDDTVLAQLSCDTDGVYTASFRLSQPALATPVPTGLWAYITRVATRGVQYHCRIQGPFSRAATSELRQALAKGESFMLLGKNLDLNAKRGFLRTWQPAAGR
ncbi:AaceriAGR255Wp [[Ashbya] aceris (nom. inval.)]|nr:AaceriAGR255Wp [[Ashbya] aceris (nom. inval.)]